MAAFDRMFDFNGDGHLDFFERALQFHVIDQASRESSADHSGVLGLSGFGRKNGAELFADNDDVDVFADAGLDYEELEFMDPLQRRGVLENAGLDPDEFDF